MPKVDGISLIAFIREINASVPIIVFTGMGYDEEQMHAALRAGANGYVSKNLPIEQLYCVLSPCFGYVPATFASTEIERNVTCARRRRLIYFRRGNFAGRLRPALHEAFQEKYKSLQRISPFALLIGPMWLQSGRIFPRTCSQAAQQSHPLFAPFANRRPGLHVGPKSR